MQSDIITCIVVFQVGGFGLPFYTAGVFLIFCGLIGIYTLPKITGIKKIMTYINSFKNNSQDYIFKGVMSAICGYFTLSSVFK